jgi:hypothetical protein
VYDARQPSLIASLIKERAMDRLELRPDKMPLARSAVIIVPLIGLLLVLYLLLTPTQATPFLLPIIVLLFLLSIIFLNAESMLEINLKERRVNRKVRIFSWTASKSYGFSDFYSILIRKSRSPGGAFIEHAYTIYYIELVGQNKICVPGESTDFHDIIGKAKELARLLSLPIVLSPNIPSTSE